MPTWRSTTFDHWSSIHSCPFPLFFKSCSPESFCLLETGLIETNGPLEPIQGDYAGLVGMLISCLLTKCCKTTQSRSTWFAPRGLTASEWSWRRNTRREGFLSGFIHTSGSDKHVVFHSGLCHSLRPQDNCTVYKITTKHCYTQEGQCRMGLEERR